jgi:retron-type reverse transcriptase
MAKMLFAEHILPRRPRRDRSIAYAHRSKAPGEDFPVNTISIANDVSRRFPASAGLGQFIPKPDGRQRPLAVAALEDKIVQRAAATLLNAIYEVDFLGFSYGFRPERGMMRWMRSVLGSSARR